MYRLILVYSDPKKAGSSLAILDGDRLRELSTPYSSYGSLSIGQTGLTRCTHQQCHRNLITLCALATSMLPLLEAGGPSMNLSQGGFKRVSHGLSAVGCRSGKKAGFADLWV